MKTIKLIIISFLTLTFASCDMDDFLENSNTEATANSSTNDTWTWVRSEFISRGLPTPKISNPDNTGIEMRIEFVELRNEVLIYHNNELVQTRRYESTHVHHSNGDRFLTLKDHQNGIYPNLDNGPMIMTAETLTILGGANDSGENHYFVKN